MISNGFPELEVKQETRTKHAPKRGYWKSINNQKAFFENLATKSGELLILQASLTLLGINDYNDWYTVGYKQILLHGGGSLLQQYGGSLFRALQAIFPQHQWTSYRFSNPHHVPQGHSFYSKNQYLLFNYVKDVSPQCSMLMNERYFVDTVYF